MIIFRQMHIFVWIRHQFGGNLDTSNHVHTMCLWARGVDVDITLLKFSKQSVFYLRFTGGNVFVLYSSPAYQPNSLRGGNFPETWLLFEVYRHLTVDVVIRYQV